MGSDIQVTSATSGKTKVFKFTKKDSAGQDLTMTATIFDRNKRDNQNNNVNALPTDMIIDSNDAIQFAGKDLAQFTAQEIAPFSRVLFKDYDETVYEAGTEKDIDAPVSYNARGISDIPLNTGNKAIKLGQFKEALEQLSIAQGGQQVPAGGQRPVGGNGVPTLQEDMFRMSIPDIRGLTNIMEESGFRGCMLMPDISANPYVMCADLDRALDGIFGPFMANIKNMMERSSGGYVPNSAPTGQTSGADAVSPADAKKAKEAKEAEDTAKKAKEAEEAEEKAKKEAIDALKKKREEEVEKIVKDISDAIKNPGHFGINDEKLVAAIKNIESENVIEVMEAWENSRHAGANEMNEKSLIKLIGDKAPDKYLVPIQEKLAERLKTKGTKDSKEVKEAKELVGIIDNDYKATFSWLSDDAINHTQELYELVKKGQEKEDIKDPLEVRIEAKFEAKKVAENKQKEKNEKAVTLAKTEATQANQELDKANKLSALWEEAIKVGVVPTKEDTIETLTAKIKDAKAKKNKKPKTKAEKEQYAAELKAAQEEQKTEARRNEQLKENAKAAAEKVKKAEEALRNPKPVKLAEPRTTEEVKASNVKAKKAIEEDNVHNEDATPWWHFWGKTTPKTITRDHIAPPVVIKEAPKAEAPTPAASTPAPAPANSNAATPTVTTVASEAKPTEAKPAEAKPSEATAKLVLTPAAKKEIEKLSKDYIDLETQAKKAEINDKPDDVRKFRREATKIQDKLEDKGFKSEEIGKLIEIAEKAAKGI